MGDPPVATLAERHWARWQAAIQRKDPVALGALQRLRSEIATGIISKHHDWELTEDDKHFAAGRPAPQPVVTAREKQILQLIADGHTTLSAARELGIGTETAKDYAHRVRAKLGARNTTHAVVIAMSRGVIE